MMEILIILLARRSSCLNGARGSRTDRKYFRRRTPIASLKYVHVIALLIGAVNSVAHAAIGAGSGACIASLTSPSSAEVKNYNAAQSAERYQQMNERGLLHYEALLGPEFVAAVQSLKPIDLLIDSGSGKGLAARQISLARGAQVVMINPQDYSGVLDFLSVLKTRDWQQEVGVADLQLMMDRKTFYPIELITSSGLKIDVKSILFGLKLIDGHVPPILDFASGPQVLSASEYKTLFRDHLLKMLKTEKLFQLKQKFEVGLTEKMLPHYQGQAKLITDVFGAFYYSPERLQILKTIYETLAEGGRAFIYLGKGIELSTASADWTPPLSAVYGGDIVRTPSGEGALSLIEWLINRYPKIMRLQRLPSSPELVLVIERKEPHALKSLDSELRLVQASYYQFRDDGFVVPKLELEEVFKIDSSSPIN